MTDSDERTSIWNDEWTSLGDEPHEGDARSRRLPHGDELGATLYELPPDAVGGPYHFHHGQEELLIVLRGQPTLRTPDGKRKLGEGEVVHFKRGPSGVHAVSNPTTESVRYVMVSTLTSPDAVEYPDSAQLSVMAKTDSQFGEPLWDIRTIEE
ncbi:MAG: cupin domain-containing protein [Halalkalicoccus sp.]